MASGTPPIDPRIANPPEPAGAAAEEDVRPVVALPRTGLPPAVFIAAMIAAAILLFMILDSRRRSQVEPAVKVRGGEVAGTSSAPPPLYIPPVTPAPAVPVVAEPAPTVAVQPPPVQIPVQQYIPPPTPYVPPQPMVQTFVPPQQSPPRQASGPTLVIDTSTAPPGSASGPGGSVVPGGSGSLSDTFAGDQSVDRVRSGIFANRSTTVAQSTLIPAVLETAFDSRRPGFARAIVSRDVRSFDGTRVLIPRGSRLTGEYRSDIQPGQKRALINWTRLIRPDGVTIAIGSPTADTLGRGGVRGDYDSHFLERFTGAFLQTALDVGLNAASRAAVGSVVVALPGSTQNVGQSLLQQNRIGPTLTVPAGTSISVFVARDLDFSKSEARR
ncbi:MAG TPA: TrbI/VirB10 family protein [Allosphingosinicella sp.]|nr:TrbI/VirB10 family protein [Allosphingosinicella sp.]